MGYTMAGSAACESTVSARYAEIRETHTGVLVLVGDRVYKGKKPIVTDFLDFSTSESRERSCEREVSSTAGSPRTATWGSHT